MKQAVLNLVQNALAAMPDGGVLTLRTDRKDDEILIAVVDTGIGIPEENLPKIFEPYFTTKDSARGGLTLTFKIVKEHGGK
jgi:signal transduction histidine kinase